jgi:Fur family peroxide stress response transcriptional regulator
VKTQRYSIQRELVGKTLAVLDHPTAAEVYDAVRRENPQISLGTVYRNLGSMSDEGTALRLSFAGSPDRFDPNTHEHYHAVCTNCGAIFDTNSEIEPGLIRKLDLAVEQGTGIRVEQRSMTFAGICPRCRAKTDGLAQAGEPEPHSRDAAA